MRSQCVYKVRCECGKLYFGETGRPLAMRLKEHKGSLNEGRLDKSKLVRLSYEGGK